MSASISSGVIPISSAISRISSSMSSLDCITMGDPASSIFCIICSVSTSCCSCGSCGASSLFRLLGILTLVLPLQLRAMSLQTNFLRSFGLSKSPRQRATTRSSKSMESKRSSQVLLRDARSWSHFPGSSVSATRRNRSSLLSSALFKLRWTWTLVGFISLLASTRSVYHIHSPPFLRRWQTSNKAVFTSSSLKVVIFSFLPGFTDLVVRGAAARFSSTALKRCSMAISQVSHLINFMSALT
mmetsp:Transcript_54243/g.69735  ORF Transcript_54243/g.69735 Transcript_54243/m.69735 type:complete len:242 (+) Transcript_54243:103-828(+)